MSLIILRDLVLTGSVTLMQHSAIYQRGGRFGAMDGQPEDWGAPAMWRRLGYADLQDTDLNE